MTTYEIRVETIEEAAKWNSTNPAFYLTTIIPELKKAFENEKYGKNLINFYNDLSKGKTGIELILVQIRIVHLYWRMTA